MADSKIPCKLFVPTSKSFQSYHAWYEEGGSNMEVGYSCKRKWQWEYIKNYYYSMTILPRSTSSIGWQLYLFIHQYIRTCLSKQIYLVLICESWDIFIKLIVHIFLIYTVSEWKLCIAHCHGVYGMKAFMAHIQMFLIMCCLDVDKGAIHSTNHPRHSCYFVKVSHCYL